MAVGDTFVLGDYTYNIRLEATSTNAGNVSVKATDKTKTSYGAIPTTVTYNGQNYTVKDAIECFLDCKNLVSAPNMDFSQFIFVTRMFKGCTSLINPPNMNVTTDYLYALEMFRDCTSLVNPPVLPNPVSGSINNLFQYEGMFRDCTSLKTGPSMSKYDSGCNVTIKRMFWGCESLESATLPKLINQSVNYAHTNNAESVFISCYALKNAPALPTDTIGSMDYCFSGCKLITAAPTIPSGITSVISSFYNCEKLTTSPTLPNGITSLERTFNNCKALQSAPIIPSGVTDLSDSFNGSGITAMPSIPNGVLKMERAFYNCKSLKTIKAIPNTATDLNVCFANSGITSAPAIPQSVLTMDHCFGNCELLINGPDMSAATNIVSMLSAFTSCSAMVNPPTMPESMPNSGDEMLKGMAQAFRGCSSLKTAPAIPIGVKSIASCFENCSSLESFGKIPSSVKYTYNAFENCTSLTGNIVVANAPSSYGSMFKGTVNTIYIIPVGDADTSTWQTVANAYTNVFFLADANAKPALSFSVTRVSANGQTAENIEGIWAYIVAVATAYYDHLPEGYTNTVGAITLTDNGVSTSPTWVSDSIVEGEYKITETRHTWLQISTIRHVFAMSVVDNYDASSPTITIKLPSTNTLLDFLPGGNGMAVGKIATRDAFDCAIPAYFNNVNIDGDIQISGDVRNTSGNAKYLPLSGGTLTNHLYLKDGTIDRDAAANSSAQNGKAIVFNDKDGERIGTIRVDRNTNGIMSMKLGTHTDNTDGAEFSEWLEIRAGRNGGHADRYIQAAAYSYNLLDTSIDRDTNPSADIWNGGFVINDKDGERIGVMQPVQRANGTIANYFQALNDKSDNVQANNYIYVGVQKDGTKIFGTADNNKFRSDLGLMGAKSANGYWGIMKPDGTDTSFFRTTQSGIIPYESGGSGQCGTSTWPFSSGYFNNLYLGGTSLTSLFYGATVNRTANYVLAGPTSGSAAHATFRKLVGADLPLATTSVQGAITAAEKAKLNAISTGTTAIIAQNTDTSNKRWRLVLTNADPANLRADVSTNDGSTWSSSADTGSIYFSKSDHSHALTSLTGTLGINHGGTGKTNKDDAWEALGGGALGKKSSLSPGRTTWTETSKTLSVPAIGHLDGAVPYEVPDGKVMTGLYSVWPSNGDVNLGGFNYNKVRLTNAYNAAKSCTVTYKWVCINSSLS